MLSGNIHGGALVASYPFDNTPNSILSSVLSTPSLTPDDDVFKHLAGVYSFNHGRMFAGEACKVTSSAPSITGSKYLSIFFRWELPSLRMAPPTELLGTH